MASLLAEVYHPQLKTQISKVEGITQHLYRETQELGRLPAALLFQEAHVPHDAPKKQYEIPGYSPILEHGSKNSEVIAYFRNDLPAAPLALRTPPPNVHTRGRIKAYTLRFEGHIIAIINVHGPHKGSREAFWSYVFGELTYTSSLFPTYIIGDTNTGTVDSDRPAGLTKVDRTFLEAMSRHGVEDLSGPPSSHAKTHHPHNSGPSRIDRALGLHHHPHPVVRAHTLPDWRHIQGEAQTYHQPLSITAAVTPREEADIPDDCSPPPAEFTQPDTEEAWQALLETMGSVLAVSPHLSISEAAAKAYGIRGYKKEAPSGHTWELDPLLRAIHDTRRGQVLQHLSRARMHNRRKQINQEIESILKQTNHIDPVKSIQHLQKLLRPPHLRQISTHRQPDGSIATDPNTVIHALRDHMKSHMNPDPTTLSPLTNECLKSLPTIASLHHNDNWERLHHRFTDREIVWAIRKLNAQARPGNDGITATLYKRLHRQHRQHLADHLWDVLTGQKPDPWTERLTKPLYKKGDPAVHGNWRPVTLPPTEQKILWILILKRLSTHIFNPDIIPLSLWGQLPGRSTREISGLLADFLDHLLDSEEEVNTLITALDLKGAFDKVSHRLIEGVWGRLGLPWGEYLSRHLRGATQKYRTAYGYTPPQTVTSGVPQGGIEGPILFLLALLPLIHHLRTRHPELSPTNLPSPVLGYADDLNILTIVKKATEYLNRLQHNAIFDLVTRYCNDNGLPVVAEKTEHVEKGPLTPQPVAFPAQHRFGLPPAQVQPQDAIKSLGLTHHADPSPRPGAPTDRTPAQEKLERLLDTIHIAPTPIHTLTTYISAVTYAQIGFQAPHIRDPRTIEEIDTTVRKSLRQAYHLPTRVGATYLYAPWQYYGGGLRSAQHTYTMAAVGTVHNNLANHFSTVTHSAITSLTREFTSNNDCPRWVHARMRPDATLGRFLTPLKAAIPHPDHAIHTGLHCPHNSPLLRPSTTRHPPGATVLRTLTTDITIYHVDKEVYDHFREYGIHHAFFLLPSPEGQHSYTHFPSRAMYEQLATAHASRGSPYPRLQPGRNTAPQNVAYSHLRALLTSTRHPAPDDDDTPLTHPIPERPLDPPYRLEDPTATERRRHREHAGRALHHPHPMLLRLIPPLGRKPQPKRIPSKRAGDSRVSVLPGLFNEEETSNMQNPDLCWKCGSHTTAIPTMLLIILRREAREIHLTTSLRKATEAQIDMLRNILNAPTHPRTPTAMRLHIADRPDPSMTAGIQITYTPPAPTQHTATLKVPLKGRMQPLPFQNHDHKCTTNRTPQAVYVTYGALPPEVAHIPHLHASWALQMSTTDPDDKTMTQMPAWKEDVTITDALAQKIATLPHTVQQVPTHPLPQSQPLLHHTLTVIYPMEPLALPVSSEHIHVGFVDSSSRHAAQPTAAQANISIDPGGQPQVTTYSHIHGTAPHGESQGAADAIDHTPPAADILILIVDALADIQCIERLARSPLHTATSTGLGRQAAEIRDALERRTRPLHLILIKTESHVACTGNIMADAWANYIERTTTPEYNPRPLTTFTLLTHVPPLCPEVKYEQYTGEEPGQPRQTGAQYHPRQYPQPATTLTLRLAHSTTRDHTAAVEKVLKEEGVSTPVHYPSYLNPVRLRAQQQRTRATAICGALPLYPRTREYHQHKYGNDVAIPEGYDTCPCGRAIETLRHLLECPIHEHHLAPAGENPHVHARQTFIDVTNRYRENPGGIVLQDDPIYKALLLDDSVPMLLRSLLPEPVWQALKQVSPRPEHAAAALQHTGLRILDTYLSNRQDTLSRRLAKQPSPTSRTYLYLTYYPGDPLNLPDPVPPPQHGELQMDNPPLHQERRKRRRRLRRFLDD